MLYFRSVAKRNNKKILTNLIEKIKKEKDDSSEILNRVQKKLVRLGLIKKKEHPTKTIATRFGDGSQPQGGVANCDNLIGPVWDSNSCYMDSVLFSLLVVGNTQKRKQMLKGNNCKLLRKSLKTIRKKILGGRDAWIDSDPTKNERKVSIQLKNTMKKCLLHNKWQGGGVEDPQDFLYDLFQSLNIKRNIIHTTKTIETDNDAFKISKSPETTIANYICSPKTKQSEINKLCYGGNDVLLDDDWKESELDKPLPEENKSKMAEGRPVEDDKHYFIQAIVPSDSELNLTLSKKKPQIQDYFIYPQLMVKNSLAESLNDFEDANKTDVENFFKHHEGFNLENFVAEIKAEVKLKVKDNIFTDFIYRVILNKAKNYQSYVDRYKREWNKNAYRTLKTEVVKVLGEIQERTENQYKIFIKTWKLVDEEDHDIIFNIKRFDRQADLTVKNSSEMGFAEKFTYGNHTFYLTSVIVHMGGEADDGHYVNWFRCANNKWKIYDDNKDDSFKRISEKEYTFNEMVEKAKNDGYLFFYHGISQSIPRENITSENESSDEDDEEFNEDDEVADDDDPWVELRSAEDGVDTSPFVSNLLTMGFTATDIQNACQNLGYNCATAGNDVMQDVLNYILDNPKEDVKVKKAKKKKAKKKKAPLPLADPLDEMVSNLLTIIDEDKYTTSMGSTADFVKLYLRSKGLPENEGKLPEASIALMEGVHDNAVKALWKKNPGGVDGSGGGGGGGVGDEDGSGSEGGSGDEDGSGSEGGGGWWRWWRWW